MAYFLTGLFEAKVAFLLLKKNEASETIFTGDTTAILSKP
jgi:hypothetical protein